MSPDMNPVEHLWNYLGRKVNARTRKCQYFSFGTGMATVPSTQTETLD
jgi:hypothetical protein